MTIFLLSIRGQLIKGKILFKKSWDGNDVSKSNE